MTTDDPRPVALVTNTVPDYRREPFRLLNEAEQVEVIAWADRPGGQRDAVKRIASRDYRAVIAGLGGRLALPGVYAAARRRRIPFVLWASLWQHPTTLVHRVSRIPTRAIYKRADAVVAYGPHVTRYVAEKRGTTSGIFEAPQTVDADHFGRSVTPRERADARANTGAHPDAFLALFVGRLVPEKGVELLAQAWEEAEIKGTLAFAGSGPVKPTTGTVLGAMAKVALPPLYAAADVLVLPSIRTATFTEPWGLVVNEAMLQGTPVITSDAVGAAAGGLVQHNRNGLITPAGDTGALANAIRTLHDDPARRETLGHNAKRDVASYTPQAWADGMRQALEHVGASRQEAG